MKKMIMAVVATVCLMAGMTAFAQQPNGGKMSEERHTPEQMAQRQTERMTENLKLTEAQAKEVYALKLSQIKEMQSQRQESMQGHKDDAEKMQKILTPEQLAQYKQMRQSMNQQRGHGPQMQQDKSCKEGVKCHKTSGEKGHKQHK